MSFELYKGVNELRVRKPSVRSKSVGTSLSNALVMITVTVINICSKNRTKNKEDHRNIS